MDKKSLIIEEATSDDLPILVDWLMKPGVLRAFPMENIREVEDAAKLWMSYTRQHAVFRARYQGKTVGIANLYIQQFKKLAHQALFAIIVDEEMRGHGIGEMLIRHLMKVGKEEFHLQYLHLEVYEANPALRLYKRLGFVEYGRQKRCLKEEGGYLDKLMMQQPL